MCLQEKKSNPNDFESIYVMQELDVPDAQRIMDLEGLLRKALASFPIPSFLTRPYCLFVCLLSLAVVCSCTRQGLECVWTL